MAPCQTPRTAPGTLPAMKSPMKTPAFHAPVAPMGSSTCASSSSSAFLGRRAAVSGHAMCGDSRPLQHRVAHRRRPRTAAPTERVIGTDKALSKRLRAMQGDAGMDPNSTRVRTMVLDDRSRDDSEASTTSGTDVAESTSLAVDASSRTETGPNGTDSRTKDSDAETNPTMAESSATFARAARAALGVASLGAAAVFVAQYALNTGSAVDPTAALPSVLEAPSATAGTSLDPFQLINAVVSDPHFVVSLGLAASAFVQTLTGFGFAIVSVGALSQVDWIAHSSVFNVIQPVAATCSAGIAWTLVLPELKKVEWTRIWPILLMSTLAAPIGTLLTDYVNEGLVLRVLGALITSYVTFSLLNLKAPKAVGGKAGAWVSGTLSGLFGGAFDITGPPLVVHGQAAGWGESFRRNLLSVVAINSTVVLINDYFTDRLNDFYYADFLSYATPGVIAGMLLGQVVARKLDPSGFKNVVLGTCLVMGARLLLS